MNTSENQAPQSMNTREPFNQHPAAKILDELKANPRVLRIRIIVSEDACPVCRKLEGEYEIDDVPDLPTLSCSRPHGLCSFYEPALTEVYP